MKANIIPKFQNDRKEDSGNDRPVSLTCITGSVMKQLTLVTMWNMMSEKITRRSQHRFTKGKTCLTKWMNFYNEITSLTDQSIWISVRLLTLSSLRSSLKKS